MLTMHGAAPPHLHGVHRQNRAIVEVLTAVRLLKVMKSAGNGTVLLGKWFVAFEGITMLQDIRNCLAQ